jgi:hypothetical protein
MSSAVPATPADGCSAVGMAVTLGRLGELVSTDPNDDVLGGLNREKRITFTHRAEIKNNIIQSKIIPISQQEKLTCDETNGAALGG